jgi:hypothetical protein
MAITTEEFEQRLSDLLVRMESWQRCQWCGCDPRQRRATAKSELCNSCKDWKRKEQNANMVLQEHPEGRGKQRYFWTEYNIEYAALCREEGGISTWKDSTTPLQLEWKLRSISEWLSGEDVFGESTLYHFEQFSPMQRRLLMFLFDELTKVYVRNRRRRFAIDRVNENHRTKESHSLDE